MRTAILLLSISCLAQPPSGYSQKYSMKDFHQRSFVNATDLNGAIIYSSNFAQVEPDTVVFPANVTGLVLVCNNLENVLIPAGATVDDRSGTCGLRRRVRVQNDGRDWEIDGQNRPVKVVSEKAEIAKGRSVNKNDIPTDGEVQARGKRFDPDDMELDKVAVRRSTGNAATANKVTK